MSDTPKAIEINCTTGEVTERPLTAAEISAAVRGRSVTSPVVQLISIAFGVSDIISP